MWFIPSHKTACFSIHQFHLFVFSFFFCVYKGLHLLYTLLVHCQVFTWTYEGVLMEPEHNSLCWPTPLHPHTSSSCCIIFVSVSSLAGPCPTSPSSLPSRFVPISTFKWSLTHLFSALSQSSWPTPVFLTQQKCDCNGFHICPLGHKTLMHWQFNLVISCFIL